MKQKTLAEKKRDSLQEGSSTVNESEVPSGITELSDLIAKEKEALLKLGLGVKKSKPKKVTATYYILKELDVTVQSIVDTYRKAGDVKVTKGTVVEEALKFYFKKNNIDIIK